MTAHHRWYPITALFFSGIGFLDATYLTIEHFTKFSLPCSLTNGCDIVTNSAYSEIFGIPVAILGVAYYLTLFLSLYLILEFSQERLLPHIALATTAGFLFSGWFVYVQIAILHAVCQYCMISAITSTTLFLLSMYYLYSLKTSSPSQSPNARPEE